MGSWRTNYCKSRIFRAHSIFVSWALRPFVRVKFSYSRWPLRIVWLALYLLHAFYFRMEAAVYEKYENNMHTKYSGFTVIDPCWFEKTLQRKVVESSVQKRRSTGFFFFARKWSWRNEISLVALSLHPLWLRKKSLFDSDTLSLAGGWRKCGALLIFVCQNNVELWPSSVEKRTIPRVKEIVGRRIANGTRYLPICG